MGVCRTLCILFGQQAGMNNWTNISLKSGLVATLFVLARGFGLVICIAHATTNASVEASNAGRFLPTELRWSVAHKFFICELNVIYGLQYDFIHSELVFRCEQGWCVCLPYQHSLLGVSLHQDRLSGCSGSHRSVASASHCLSGTIPPQLFAATTLLSISNLQQLAAVPEGARVCTLSIVIQLVIVDVKMLSSHQQCHRQLVTCTSVIESLDLAPPLSRQP